MNAPNGNKRSDLLDEADIGSGEREPGQQDTDKIIEQIGQGVQERQNGKAGSGERGEAGGKDGSSSP